ncbi:antibiotic biosynthesis monooxygenase [Conexibacter sp. CPCC 206217]|uniref:antibiotic biosynthesis monooxygenase family protein n=1 Tax=Conexibacter sp. CPCC 206217 TaxID=3064574 RepID=UPI00271DC6F5|nr:antibiotic biosynthesis monooxygenase [Conexibacter sp. CPCC 206217]MDO8212135.1 antibiotic biosynthesis monooxygenase [Conexibacter sp. CPCC 206217]
MAMIVVMNVVHVTDGRHAEFEAAFRRRERHLHEQEGFAGFELLRRDESDEYAVVTRWESHAAFETWVGSDAFFASHAERDHTLTERVEMRTYEVVPVDDEVAA